MHEIKFFKLFQTILAFYDTKLEIVYHWLKEKVNSSKEQFRGSRDPVLKISKLLLKMSKFEPKLLGDRKMKMKPSIYDSNPRESKENLLQTRIIEDKISAAYYGEIIWNITYSAYWLISS
jgi:hypothetical protein